MDKPLQIHSLFPHFPSQQNCFRLFLYLTLSAFTLFILSSTLYSLVSLPTILVKAAFVKFKELFSVLSYLSAAFQGAFNLLILVIIFSSLPGTTHCFSSYLTAYSFPLPFANSVCWCSSESHQGPLLLFPLYTFYYSIQLNNFKIVWGDSQINTFNMDVFSQAQIPLPIFHQRAAEWLISLTSPKLYF